MARGDQIYLMQEFLSLEGVYEHHGIDCGDGTVIHQRKRTETIERTSFATFMNHSKSKVYVRNYRTCFIPDAVVQRAESRLGEKNYNLLFNNCEHFATWCKTGVSESRQVKNFIPVIANLDTDSLSAPIFLALKHSDRGEALRGDDRRQRRATRNPLSLALAAAREARESWRINQGAPWRFFQTVGSGSRRRRAA